MHTRGARARLFNVSFRFRIAWICEFAKMVELIFMVEFMGEMDVVSRANECRKIDGKEEEEEYDAIPTRTS